MASTSVRMSAADFRALQSGEAVKKKGRIQAKRTTIDGICFHSNMEAQRYAELAMMQKAGLITDLELQPEYPFEENGFHCFKYLADFRYRQGGAEVVEDVKGQRTQIYMLKKRLIEARYGISIREWPEKAAAKPAFKKKGLKK